MKSGMHHWVYQDLGIYSLDKFWFVLDNDSTSKNRGEIEGWKPENKLHFRGSIIGKQQIETDCKSDQGFTYNTFLF